MNSLRTRLFAAIVLVVVLSIGLSLGISAILTRRAVDRSTQRALTRQADFVGERARKGVSPLPVFVREISGLLGRQNERALIVKRHGTSPFLPPEAAAAIESGKPAEGRVRVNGTEYFYAAQPVGRRALVLVRPTRIGKAYTPYLEALLIGAAVSVALAAIVALLFARVTSRPVRRVAAAARRLPLARTPEPVPVEGASELRSLAESFNEMAAELTRAREAERQFLLSVSHELKTPLTAIVGYTEALADGAVTPEEGTATIAREATRLDRLIRDLLDLARMNKSEFSFDLEPIDLSVAAREVVRRYEPQARAFEVALDAIAEEPAPATGDADRVLQIVSNLVENALRLTPAGGSVQVSAKPGHLLVEDTGPGLAPEELSRAFERFFLHERYGGEREVGTGLGLAIVKELARGMGGDVTVESEPGRWTRFTVRLPGATIPARADEPALAT
jgi:two-component system, OmpR family, sensor kinase